MRRWLSGLLAALTLFSLTACGGLADLPEIPEKAQVEDAGLLPAEEAEGMEDPTDTEDPGDAAQEEGDPALPAQPDAGPEGQEAEPAPLPEDGSYTTKEDVALYIYTYGHLPGNFITKKEAQNLGWPGGDLEPYAPGKCIGGSRFGNYEGLLPDAEGRTWTECDIDTLGAGSRGAKRVVFSNDGLIYYTGDHYESFELLYGDAGDG
nr:ribonuclease domain-containing protein [uncultured Oscillibacter sp.]